MIHHIELWVPNLTRAEASWGWLLVELGYQPFIQWPEGQSWRAGAIYIVLEQSQAAVDMLGHRLVKVKSFDLK